MILRWLLFIGVLKIPLLSQKVHFSAQAQHKSNGGAGNDPFAHLMEVLHP